MVTIRVPTKNKVTLKSFLPSRQRGIPMRMSTAPHNQEYFCIQVQRALREYTEQLSLDVWVVVKEQV